MPLLIVPMTIVSIAIMLGLLGAGSSAQAEDKIQLLVIGNNQPPIAERGRAAGALPETLHYADDDAVGFYALLAPLADRAHLLTVMDAETEARHAPLVAQARPPTLAHLREAVAALARRMEENRVRGDRNVVYVFFSGHGAVLGGTPTLALLDGGLGHELLYDVLGGLPADYLHLFVDACHAEAVVRPRDERGRTVAVPAADANALLTRATLARFPNVGAILAANGDAQAHEWDALRHGVFTYELLSALRGAADVNHDGKIEYSEAVAFLAAANRGVEDPRGRLSVVARAPDRDRHVPLIELGRLRATGTAELRGVPTHAGLVEVEDALGRRLASTHGEPGFAPDLVLPAGTTFVRSGGREARFESTRGDVVPFGRLAFRAPDGRARGALEDAVREGLFAREFGPRYYRGFIDQAAPELVPVAFADPRAWAPDEAAWSPLPPPAAATTVSPAGHRLSLGVGATRTVTAGLGTPWAASAALQPEVFGARPTASLELERGLVLTLELSRAASRTNGGGATEWQTAGAVGWQWSARRSFVAGWLGADVMGGAFIQSSTAEGQRWSPVAGLGPFAGVGCDVGARLGLWFGGSGRAVLVRQDHRTVVSLVPWLAAGVSLGI